jgi:hypothetical protein
VAGNVVVVAPTATDTVAGTVTAVLLLERAIVVAPDAAADKVTVQLELAPDEIVVGLHVSAEIVGGAASTADITPPVPVTDTLVPATDDPMGYDTAMEALVRLEVVVKEATATIPLDMVLAFVPDTRHMYVPLLPLQLIDLPAAVAAGPAVTVMP